MEGLSENNIYQSQHSILVDSGHDSPVCLVCFGGIRMGIGIPVFEFFNSLNPYRVNKIFVRDFSQAWYHRGLPGHSSDVLQTADVIRQYLPAGTRKTVFIGNSMGGFAALLYGTLLRADCIHAFVPQTFIDPINRLRHRDLRWASQLGSMYLHTLLRPKRWDLRELVMGNTSSEMHVHFGDDDRLDLVHAQRLQGTPVQLHTYADAAHNVTKLLRDSGELDALLRRAIS